MKIQALSWQGTNLSFTIQGSSACSPSLNIFISVLLGKKFLRLILVSLIYVSLERNQYLGRICRPFYPSPNKPWFLRVCSKGLLKTLWEKEKLLVTSNFSFSHSVFYPFGKLTAIFIKFEVVVCKFFEFGTV